MSNSVLASFSILFAAIFTNNILLTNYLGMCSFLAISRQMKTSIGLGAAVVFVMTCTTALNWMVYYWLLVPLDLTYLRFIVFIMVIAAFVQMLEMIIERVSDSLYTALGIFLPLITVNCAILGIALFMVIRSTTSCPPSSTARGRPRLGAGHRADGRHPPEDAALAGAPRAGGGGDHLDHRGIHGRGLHRLLRHDQPVGTGGRMFDLNALLISLAAFCGLSVALAFVMVVADATVGNYGDIKVNINDGTKEVVGPGGRPLLFVLSEQKLFIPSACGGRGSCGLCKVQVTSDIGEYLPTELPWISDEEKKHNVRLSCQIKVKKDLAIQIPEELFSVKEYRTKVARIRDLTHDIKEVTLQMTDPPEISIRAGQYIQFEVPEYELTPERVYRAYSVSSPPSLRDAVELEVRLVPNGICTTYVFQHLKEGDEVKINGPYGDFYLRDTGREIVFIAGGSGMAPIKSILMDMAEKGSTRKATYFFGAQAKRDLFLVDEMRELEKRLPNFRFVPALSRPNPEDDWKEETGLITAVLDRQLRDGLETEAYLCGSPGMIDASIAVLTAKGFTADRIFYDKFA